MDISINTLLEGKGRALYSVQSTVTVFEAVQEMNRCKIGAMLVMKGSELAGIFTERDVLTRVVAGNLDPQTTPVTQVMTSKVLTINPNTSVKQVVEMFTEKRCRHLPVLDDGQLVGLISIGDVTRWVANAYQFEAESLRHYIAGGLSM